MKDCFKRFFLPSLALVLFASAFFGSCTDVDNQLGMGLLPKDQEMTLKETTIGGIKSYMAFSDSLPVSNLNLMVLGNYTNDTFGYLRSSAAVQFFPYAFAKQDGSYNGYKPHADSAHIYLEVTRIYGNTKEPQTFNIYPLVKALPKYREKDEDDPNDEGYDGIIYGSFDAEPYADMTKLLFTFKMENEKVGSITKRLNAEPDGLEYMQRLFAYGAEDDYEIYSDDDIADIFRNEFKGFYITPSPTAPRDAAIYVMTPLTYIDSYYQQTNYTYFSISGHSHYAPDDELPDDEDDDEDPEKDDDGEIIKDKLITTYNIDDTYISKPSVTILSIERDYSSAMFNESDFVDPEKFTGGPSFNPIYVQGLLGVAGYLDFGGDFLTNLRALARTDDGVEHILKINRARLYIWLRDENYTPGDEITYLREAPSRMGMYYNYKSYYPENIPDYYYTVEQSQQDVSAPYGGYLNRAKGYYEMDISMYLRDLLSDEDTPRQVWLAPGHTPEVFYSPSRVALSNTPWNGTGEPPAGSMQLKIAYTLVKKVIND